MAYTFANLLTNSDGTINYGDFEYDATGSTTITGWSATQGASLLSVDSSTITPQTGTKCLKVTKAATSGTGIINNSYIALDTAGNNPASPTTVYVFSGYVQVNVVGQSTTLNAYIRWYNSSNTAIGYTTRIINNIYAGRGWVSFLVQDPAPTSAAYAKVEISELGSPYVSSTTPVSGNTFYVDNLSFYELNQAEKTAIVNKTIAAVPVSKDTVQYTGPKLKSDISLGSLVLNTIDSRQVVWICTDIAGWWDTADLELPDIPRGLDDGSFEAYGRWTTRSINMSGSILPPDYTYMDPARNELFRQINLTTNGAWLIVDEIPVGDTKYPAGLSRASWVHLSAKPTLAVKNPRGRIDFQVPLKAHDPIKYEWNWADAKGFTNVAVTRGLTGTTVTNKGNSKVNALYTLSGAAPVGTTIQVNSTTKDSILTSQVMTLTTALNSGDVLIIDTFERQVYINGSTSCGRAYLSVNLDWAKIYPGDNQVFVLNYGSATPTLNVSFRSGWIG